MKNRKPKLSCLFHSLQATSLSVGKSGKRESQRQQKKGKLTRTRAEEETHKKSSEGRMKFIFRAFHENYENTISFLWKTCSNCHFICCCCSSQHEEVNKIFSSFLYHHFWGLEHHRICVAMLKCGRSLAENYKPHTFKQILYIFFCVCVSV